MTTLDTILDFFKGKGLSSAQAAGIAGNWQVESSLNPAAVNPREGAIGLAQWEGGRRTALQAYARATGSTEDNLITQLNYAWQELSGPESGALAKLKATSDPGAAAAAFDQYFERSSGSARATRISDAQAIASGHPTTTGSTSSSSSSSSSSSGSSGDSVASSLSSGGLFGTGLFDWMPGVFTIAVKTVAGGAAAALVIAGAVHTISD